MSKQLSICAICNEPTYLGIVMACTKCCTKKMEEIINDKKFK